MGRTGGRSLTFLEFWCTGGDGSRTLMPIGGAFVSLAAEASLSTPEAWSPNGGLLKFSGGGLAEGGSFVCVNFGGGPFTNTEGLPACVGLTGSGWARIGGGFLTDAMGTEARSRMARESTPSSFAGGPVLTMPGGADFIGGPLTLGATIGSIIAGGAFAA